MSRLQDLTHPKLRGMSGNRQPAGASRSPNNAGRGANTNVSQDVGRQAQDLGRRFQVLGRIGWVAKGVVYLLIGLVALNIALDRGQGDQEASGTGAVAKLADRSFGKLLIGVLGAGLVLYVIWRLFTALLPGDWTGKALLYRVGYLVSALVYASLALTVV
ncbi:MAG: DUF1206 domain-containing protein [Acidimicrobiales bacterium]